jgi:hypothetical protein
MYTGTLVALKALLFVMFAVKVNDSPGNGLLFAEADIICKSFRSSNLISNDGASIVSRINRSSGIPQRIVGEEAIPHSIAVLGIINLCKYR